MPDTFEKEALVKKPLPGPRRDRYALIGLLILAVLYTLNIGQVYFLPVAVALVLNFILSPVVRAMRRYIRLPEAVGAAVVLLALFGLTGWGIYLLGEPASEWMDKAPRSIRAIERKVRQLRGPVEQVNRAAAEVENLTRMGKSPTVQKVEIDAGGLSDSLLSGTQRVIGSTAIIAFLLFFLLASGDRFLGKWVAILPLPENDKAVFLRIAERQVSNYLFTITVINICLGMGVAIAMALLHVPNPLLWGVLAGFLNFVPYLGALVCVSVLTLVSALSFETTPEIMLPPLAYLVLTSLEGLVITPTVLGKRLSLNPVVIILWLLLWGWMWGITGAFLAVPMLAIVKILCDHLPSLKLVAELLGR